MRRSSTHKSHAFVTVCVAVTCLIAWQADCHSAAPLVEEDSVRVFAGTDIETIMNGGSVSKTESLEPPEAERPGPVAPPGRKDSQQWSQPAMTSEAKPSRPGDDKDTRGSKPREASDKSALKEEEKARKSPEPVDPAVLLSRAQDLLDKGEYASALSSFSAALEKASQSNKDKVAAAASHGAAQAALKLGKPDEALEHVKRSIDLNRSMKNARARSLDYLLAGRIFMSQEKFSQAAVSLEEARTILPVSETSAMPGLLEDMGTCLLRLHRYDEALKAFQRALAMRVKAGDKKEAAGLNLNIGEILVSRSDYRSAMVHFNNARKSFQDLGDNKQLGETLFRIAYLHQTLGDIKTARKLVQEAQSCQGTGPETQTEALPLVVKGMAAHHEGKIVQAVYYLTQALNLYEKKGDRIMASRVRLALADLQMGRSRLKSALELGGKTLAEFRDLHSPGGEAGALLLISRVYFRQGFSLKALEYAQESARISKRINDKDQTVQSNIVLAEIHQTLGDMEAAFALLKEAVEGSKSGVNTRTRAHVRVALARYRLSREDFEKALPVAQAARKEFQEINDRRGTADCDHLIGLVYELQGDRDKALSFFERALKEHRAIWDRYGEGRDLTALGVHYKNRGKPDRAHDYFVQARDLRRVIGDHRGYAANLANIGNLQRHGNDLSAALKNLDRALTTYRELSDKKGEADTLTNLGHVEAARGLRSAALEKFQQALSIHRDIRDVRGAAIDLAGIGKIYLAAGDPENAAAALEEAHKINKRINNPKGEVAILAELAMVQRARMNQGSALSLLKQARELAHRLKDVRAAASINLKMASVFEDAGDFEKALSMLRETLTAMQRLEDRRGELWALGGIGIIQVKMEDYENALSNLHKAQGLSVELGVPASHSRDLDLYLGEIYDGFREYEKALAHYQKALSLYQVPGNDAVLGRIYDRIGNIYYRMEEYEKAKSYFEDALRMSGETRDVAAEQNQLIRLGDISSKLATPEEALKYQQKALVLARERSDERTEARIMTRIGILYQMSGRPRTALENYRQARDIRLKLGDGRGINENLLQIALVTSILGDFDAAITDLKRAFEIAQCSEDRSMLWKAYFIMGRTLESRKRNGEALESYRKAIAILEATEADTVEESAEDDFIFGGKSALYETTLRVLMKLARRDPQGAYDNQALKIVEKIKEADFENTLSRINVVSFSDLPNELLVKEKSLKLSLRKLNARLAEERSSVRPNQEVIKKLLDERRDKEGRFVKLKDRLEKEYPGYAGLRYPRPVSVHHLQKDVINRDEAIIGYMVTRSRTYVFAIDKNRFYTYSVDCSRQELERDVNTLTRPLFNADTQASWDPSVAHRLYLKLVKPIEHFLSTKKTVVIVPHGPLCALPFEVLVDSKAHAEKRFWSATDRPSYLLERYSFCYAPSISVLSQVRTRKTDQKPGWNLVAFGDAVYRTEDKTMELNPGADRLINAVNTVENGARGRNLSPLPAARREINEIAKIVGGPSQVYFGAQATETLFKKADLSRYGYVHLATHGVLLSAGGKSVGHPAIVFSLYGDSQNDGFLQLGEVFGLKLNSDLVVLSSCLASDGNYTGEAMGLMGLSRAFLFAGTDSVVLSLWQVNDDSTAKLFIEMYRNLNDGSKAEALRKAKLSLLNNVGTSHPYYWAPFILMGNWNVKYHPSFNKTNPETMGFKGRSGWRKWLSM
ncbi:MAG: tetratricopeptide repeat protein [Desulfomonilaceae bacterium]|nr:tetratricopeptide repeat protein [Desulfomonilaceae bacterium]